MFSFFFSLEGLGGGGEGKGIRWCTQENNKGQPLRFSGAAGPRWCRPWVETASPKGAAAAVASSSSRLPERGKARRRRWRRRRRGFRSAEFAPRVVVGGGELLSVRGPAVDRACGRENPASAASAARRAACGGYVVGQDRSGLALPVSRRRYPRRQRHLVVRGDAAGEL